MSSALSDAGGVFAKYDSIRRLNACTSSTIDWMGEAARVDSRGETFVSKIGDGNGSLSEANVPGELARDVSVGSLACAPSRCDESCDSCALVQVDVALGLRESVRFGTESCELVTEALS